MNSMCPFCDRNDVLLESDLCYAIVDRRPVTKGHTLVIPRRHYADVFESTRAELESMVDMIKRLRAHLDEKYAPRGYNIGVNCGRAAGQSIMHVHFHVIPRYRPDGADPREGIRGVIPDEHRYG